MSQSASLPLPSETSHIGVELRLSIKVRGPLLVHSSSIGPWGLDAVALRDRHNHLVITGDAVQSKVREAFDEFGADAVDSQRSRKADMQGSIRKSSKSEFSKFQLNNLDIPPSRYPLFFSDFVSVKQWPAAGFNRLARTSIDGDSGTAETGSLRNFDCPLQPGRIAEFCGVARFFARDEAQADCIADQLSKAMSWIASFGSQKTTGLGRQIAGATSATQIIRRFSRSDVQQVKITGSVALADFEFLDLLCHPTGVVNGNIYESRNEIPGEAIRGALAQLLWKISGKKGTDLSQVAEDHPYPLLCKYFDRVRIGIARPISKTKSVSSAQPSPIPPLSLAIADKKVFDLALLSRQETLELFAGQAAALAPDWKLKEWQAVERQFDIVYPAQELRVKTAIDSEKGTALENNLFALRGLRPESHHWRTMVTIDDRDQTSLSEPLEANTLLSQCIAALSSGWLSMGRTRARGKLAKCVAYSLGDQQTLPKRFNDRDTFVVMLRSPALMIDPRRCHQSGNLKSMADIDQLYTDYWNEVSGGALEEIAEQRFKRDELVGGFQARKYRYSMDDSFDLRTKGTAQQRIAEQKLFPYNPTLLAGIGSVFVLRVAEASNLAAAQAKIYEWQRYGLPLPDWAAKAYGDTHHTNIFLPQNGYGEIDVNLACHKTSFDKPLTKIEDRNDS